METKNIIIIGIIAIILTLLIGIIVFTFMGNATAYETFTCNDTGTTFEVPKGLKVRQDQENFGIRYSIMSTPDGDIVIQRSLGDNPYMASGMSGASDLINSYDGDKVNGVELHTCSRTVKNEATGEVIMVTSNRGDNETVEHIINSIHWGNKTSASNSNSSTATSSGPSAYAYKSDGTPMYSQDEVDKYMEDKYGDVNYHIGSNGYVDMDEPGYDDAGHYVESTSSQSYSSRQSSSSHSDIETTVDSEGNLV